MVGTEPQNTSAQGWHREQIKAAIRMRGISCADLSKRLRVTPEAVGLVIRGKHWSAVERGIARFLGVALHELWPDRYHANGRSRIRRRVSA